MQLICNNPSDRIKNLTKDKRYDIIEESGEYVYVTSDDGEVRKYKRKIFRSPLTVQDVVNRFNIRNNILRYQQNDLTTITRNNTSISCGIDQLTSVLDISDTIMRKLETLPDIAHLSTEEVFKEVVIKIFNEFKQPRLNNSAIIMSSNIEGDDVDNEQENLYMFEVLDEMCETVELPINRNSGNPIKLWVLKCND